jgi:hypothetical protein
VFAHSLLPRVPVEWSILTRDGMDSALS